MKVALEHYFRAVKRAHPYHIYTTVAAPECPQDCECTAFRYRTATIVLYYYEDDNFSNRELRWLARQRYRLICNMARLWRSTEE